MGSNISRHQADLLATHFDRVRLMLDGDEAGRQGAASIARTLAPRIPTMLVSLRHDTQLDQLTPEEIRHVVGEFCS